MQAAALGVTLAFAIVGGIVTGNEYICFAVNLCEPRMSTMPDF